MTRITKTRAMIAVGAASLGALGIAAAAFAGHTNTILTTSLNGRNEVAAGAKNSGIVGDPNARGEAYVFGIDNDPATLCYVLTVNKLSGATAAHIHEAAAGSNGPVVVSLAAPGDGNAADCLTEGEPGKFATDANGVPRTSVAEILAHPADYYVNVHNADYPGGAIRGQLSNLG